MKRVCFLFLLFKFLTAGHITKFKIIDSFWLEQKTLIGEPISFFVDNNEYIYLLDEKLANLKVFNPQGKLIKVFGTKGSGPNEFLNPVHISHFRDILMIYDFKRKRLFFYKIKSPLNLSYIKDVKFGDLSMDFKFLDVKKMLIAGHSLNREDGISYSLYELNLKNNNVNYIIPSFCCYKLKNEREYTKKFLKEIIVLSPDVFGALCDNSYFCVSSLDLHVAKKEKESKKIIYFYKPSPTFVRPFVTREMKEAIRIRNRDKLNRLLQKMSFVKGLFCMGNGRLLLLYSSFDRETKGRDLYSQIYDLQGNCLLNQLILKLKSEYDSDILVFFDKTKNILYIIAAIGNSEEFEIKYKFFKIKIL